MQQTKEIAHQMKRIWEEEKTSKENYVFNWIGLAGFYSISAIVGYLMSNPVYTYILNIYDLVWLDFIAYQPLYVI